MVMLGAFLLTACVCEVQSYFGLAQGYKVVDIAAQFAPPSLEHWFGTDYLGRDVFARTMQGSRTALKVGFVATLISMFIGTVLGMIAGYFGGWVDDFVNWLYSTFASMPTMLFILAFAMLVSKGFLFPGAEELLRHLRQVYGVDTGMLAVYLGIGLTGWVSLCKVTRAETLKLREAQFVQAAQLTGVRTRSILFKHIFPNLIHIVIIYATMRFGFAIMTEVIVSYLGLGVSMEPSWGTMISEGQQRLWQGMWWEVAAATFAIFWVVLPLNLLGDRLRDILDPRLQQ